MLTFSFDAGPQAGGERQQVSDTRDQGQEREDPRQVLVANGDRTDLVGPRPDVEAVIGERFRKGFDGFEIAGVKTQIAIGAGALRRGAAADAGPRYFIAVQKS